MHYVTVQNKYTGPAKITVNATKNNSVIAEATLGLKNALFDIYPVMYMAWYQRLKKGDSFSTSDIPFNCCYPINYVVGDETTGQPSKTITVTVTNEGFGLRASQSPW